MRIFDNIPESEIINTYLGDLITGMVVESKYVFSPSKGSHCYAMLYWKRNLLHMAQVSYTNTAKAIMIRYYEDSDDDPNRDPITRWVEVKRYLIKLSEPDGSKKVQDLVNEWVPGSMLEKNWA